METQRATWSLLRQVVTIPSKLSQKAKERLQEYKKNVNQDLNVGRTIYILEDNLVTSKGHICHKATTKQKFPWTVSSSSLRGKKRKKCQLCYLQTVEILPLPTCLIQTFRFSPSHRYCTTVSLEIVFRNQRFHQKPILEILI